MLRVLLVWLSALSAAPEKCKFAIDQRLMAPKHLPPSRESLQAAVVQRPPVHGPVVPQQLSTNKKALWGVHRLGVASCVPRQSGHVRNR
ncbi:MAG TPA: hypothetical protein VFI32_03040, partial [Rhodanobacteraceae bacterium]|nr:hypothetical protein [Rhodanobacteraceae bacterium]